MPMIHPLPPLSLYVHIPWCVRKCPYCDFNSHEASNSLPEAEYIKALERDLEQDKNKAQGRKLTSIFFGGGTPSLFSASAIADIVKLAERHIGFQENIEITLEANPGTAEYTSFSELLSAGVNRLSMGIQSFNDKHLTKLGRIHSAQEAIDAFNKARKEGFTNINLDLMHGLPQQTPEEACKDLNTAVCLSPEHLSWYQLTIEPNTVFYNKPPKIPQDDTLADIQEAGETVIANNGYRQYEVSAYCQSEQQSKHNLNYWQFGDYLGIGAGAHSKISYFNNQNTLRITRYRKKRQPNDYIATMTSNTIGHINVPMEKRSLEFMMNILRLRDGAPLSLFEERTGAPFITIANTIKSLQSQGLIADQTEGIKTTPLGFRFLNSVLAQFDEPV